MKNLILLILLGLISATGFAQSTDRNQESDDPVPLHISHELNNADMIRELTNQRSAFKSAKKATKAVDEVGDEKLFWVYNVTKEQFNEVNFRLMLKGQSTQIWFEISEIENNHLNPAVADSMYKFLEEVGDPDSFRPEKGIVELSNEIFGEAPNYDGDGLVDFLVTDIKDNWEQDCDCGYTAGFFYSVDQFSEEDVQAFDPDLHSNERDILYIDSYPGITNSNGVTNAERPLPTLAHEYQHLIHYNYNSGQNSQEFTFINEAQSNFASLLNGYFPHPSYNDYLEDTNVPIFRWDRSGDVLPDYGRAASFTGYLWGQLGFENAGTLTRSPLNGVEGIEAAIEASGSDLTFDELLVNWGLANLLNNKEGIQNQTYSYSHPFLNDLATSNYIVLEPVVSAQAVNVQKGGIAYTAFMNVQNLDLQVNFDSEAGRAYLITNTGTDIEVQLLENGIGVQTPENISYEEAYLMFVNTEAGPADLVDTETLEFTYSASVYETTSSESDILSPLSFELRQNYPNPFNPSTTIAFTLPGNSDVQLDIFDSSGQKVATLLNSRLSAGSHSVQWDASGMASGLYLYKIQAGEYLQIKKMILLK